MSNQTIFFNIGLKFYWEGIALWFYSDGNRTLTINFLMINFNYYKNKNQLSLLFKII
jgi:hypothetical protein